MSEERIITILLFSENISIIDELRLSSKLIEDYNLPFVPEDIIRVFRKVRVGPYDSHTEPRQREFVLYTLLAINKRMYIALILALNDNFNPKDIKKLTNYSGGSRMAIGCWYDEYMKTFYKLLDYYNFDDTNLVFIPSLKKSFQKYADKKHGCGWTKKAIKK